MKSHIFTHGLIGLVGLLMALAVYGFICPSGYFLANRNLEMVFIVTNEESGEPIPNTSIDLLMKGGAWNKETGVVHLVTDDEGKVRHVHENNSCEDVIRPFQKKVTFIDLCWASVNVSAKGYQPVEGLWLHEFKYNHKGYISEGNFQRIELNLRLRKHGRK